MCVKELIERLQCFDLDHNVIIKVFCPCGCGEYKYTTDIQDLEYHLGECAVITGKEGG